MSKEYLNELYNNLTNKYTDDMVGVHFSRMEEVSFNPKPFHHDPIGVYVFPRKWILDNLLSKNTMFSKMPYQYIIIPTSKAVFLDLDMTLKKAQSLLKQMGIPETYLTDGNTYHRSTQDSVGHMFWGAIERYRHDNKLSKNMSWNTLFKKTKYNALIDNGNSIIHSNEPYQYVYLEPGTFKVVTKFSNKGYGKIITDFANTFKELGWEIKRRKKQTSYSHPELSITKGRLQIIVALNDDYVHIKAYGFKDEFDKSYGNTWRGGDPSDALKDVVNFIESTSVDEREDEYQIQKEKDKNTLIEYAKEFGFKSPSPRDVNIFRVYEDKEDGVKVKLLVYIHQDLLNVRIQKQKSYYWKNYYYYSEAVPIDGDFKKATITALNQIEDNIKTDLESNDFDKKVKAKTATRNLKYIRRNVFKL